MKLSEGCYLLRSNMTDWSGELFWRALKAQDLPLKLRKLG